MTEEHVGKVVDGRYRLDHVLGEGTMGAVYAATQLSVDRTVAVKLLHRGDDSEFGDRFQREARAIGKLSHTNIITLHDFGWDDDLGAHYMVTEYAEGVPLSERMKEVMSTELILKVALEVASAMHHAHAQGITHRDLKPENVILTRADGRVDVAKVLDFGLAQLYDPDHDHEQEHEPPPDAAESDDYVYGEPDDEEGGYASSDGDQTPYGDSLSDIDEPEEDQETVNVSLGKNLLDQIDSLASEEPSKPDRNATDDDVATVAGTARETARYEPAKAKQPESTSDEEPATEIIPRLDVEAHERDAAAAFDEVTKGRENEDE